jgi:hypothetical protein
MEGQAEFMCQDIRSAAGKNAKGNSARRESVDDFVDSSIAATGEDYVGAVLHRSLGQFVRHVGARRGRKLNFESRPAKNSGGFVNFAFPPVRTPPRHRIKDESPFFQFWILDRRFWIGIGNLPAAAAGKNSLQSKVQKLNSGY